MKRGKMKAVFGKLNVLCFVAVVVGMVISYVPFVILDNDPMGMALMLFYLSILFIPLGLIFFSVSAVKKEIPKYYRYIGLFLIFLLVLMWIYFYFLECEKL